MNRSNRRFLPIVAGVALAAIAAWVQFMIPLGNYSIFAEILLAIGFYFCYAWHERIAAAETAQQVRSESKG